MSSYKKKRKRGKKLIVLLFGLAIIILSVFIIYDNNQIAHKTGKQGNASVKTVSYFELYNPYKESLYPDKVFGVPVHTQLIEENTDARVGTKRLIQYVVIHETDNFVAGTGAANHAEYLSNNNTSSTSWHYTVDDHEIYHHIPDDEIAHHAGDATGNEFGIGIELCVNPDGDFDKTFENGAKLAAFLLKNYGLTIDNLRTHHDFTGKDCPHSILQKNRLDEFKKRVEYYYSRA